MSEKYTDLEKQCKKLETDLKCRERELQSGYKEREAIQRELNRSILLQEKLKDVCREQQKLIKSVDNQSTKQIREEEKRHKESQAKFQKSLNEINGMLTKNNEENVKLRNENIEMFEKLSALKKQCQDREQQMKQFEEKIKIDTQLQEAKLNKIRIECNIEKEILLQEKEDITKRLLDTQNILKDSRESEAVLREQLNIYSKKYDTFQNAIHRSNNMFDKYKGEIEMMSKNTRSLEKEALEWKKKYEKCNATLIDLAIKRSEEEQNANKSAKQMKQLQKLLRTLHIERTTLYKILAENKIECPNIQQEISEQAIILHLSQKSQSDRFETMVNNFSEIKENLANVQEKMKAVEMEQNIKKQLTTNVNVKEKGGNSTSSN